MDLEKDIPHAYSTNDPTSFACTSAQNRWPSILTNAIDDCARTLHNPEITGDDHQKIEELKSIIRKLGELKYELQHNRTLSPLPVEAGKDISAYNQELAARGNPTWHECQWLFAECYLYRRIATIFSQSTHWKTYDVFNDLKMSTLKSSRPAVIELAARYHEITTRLHSDGPVAETFDPAKQEDADRRLFIEMCEICLWGNATDLSLLTTLSYDDIQKLQGSNARKASEKNILVNDLDKAFDVLNRLKKERKSHRRVDIVLDNAGFELYVDLMLAGYLYTTGLATEVVLHPKNIPWFVSDVVPGDFNSLMSALKDPRGFFPHDGKPDTDIEDEEEDDLEFCHKDWLLAGTNRTLMMRFNAFWTHAGSFWRMRHTAPKLFRTLKDSDLVIFKGDLNYRKLTGDVRFTPCSFLWFPQRNQKTDRSSIYRAPGIPQHHSPPLLGHMSLRTCASSHSEPVRLMSWSDYRQD